MLIMHKFTLKYASHTIPILSLKLFILSIYYQFLNYKNFLFTSLSSFKIILPIFKFLIYYSHFFFYACMHESLRSNKANARQTIQSHSRQPIFS